MSQYVRWYSVDADDARLFRLGEWLAAGTLLGLSSIDSRPLQAEEDGVVVGVQYDIDQQRLILAVQPMSRPTVYSTMCSGPGKARVVVMT